MKEKTTLHVALSRLLLVTGGSTASRSDQMSRCGCAACQRITQSTNIYTYMPWLCAEQSAKAVFGRLPSFAPF